MRIDVYTWQDAYVATIGPEKLYGFTHTDELNGEDSVAITTTFPLKQGYRLVWADRLNKVHEHVCQDPKGLHADGLTLYTDTALNSVVELYGDYIEDKRPYGYSYLKALEVALAPTRWQCGTVDQTGTVASGLTFYHISAREALQKILSCGGELETVIEVSGGKVSSRKVGIRQHRGDSSTHRRFTYTKDLVSISRTEHFSAITACYGYGKGVETDNGGYGRKLTFGDINGGLNYVADSTALKEYGRPSGTGFAHVFGQYENSECEDASQLLSETKAYLAEHNEPGVTYEADVVDLVQFGRSWEGVSVGDDVQIVDKEFSPELRCSGRVTKLVTDLLGGTQTVNLGNVTETMADMWAAQQQAVSSLSRRSSSWDVAASTPAAYLQQVVDGLNEQFNLNGNSYCFTSFEKGTIYSSVPLDENGNPTKTGGSALQLCSQGFRIASTTKADGSWDWRTFGTGSGFTADLITAGTINAGLVKAGTLQDKTGTNYWNMETGDFRLTGVAKADETISAVDVEYAQGTSATVAPTTEWQTKAPAWESGKYIWTRTKTTMQDGKTVTYSTPVMISGRDGQDGSKGDKGATGTGVSAIVEQYYLSTSSQTQTGGSWSETCPAWESGKYIWTRSRVTWTVGDPTTTQPVLAGGINSANETAADAKQAVSDLDGSLDQEEVFNRLTGGGSNQGIYLESGKLYVNGTYIKTGTINAGLVKAGTLQDKTGTNYWNMETGDFRLTGVAKADETISAVDVEYAQGTSATVAPTTEWQTKAPAWESGKYIWTRTKTTMQDGKTVTYSTPVMISGRDGQDGSKGDKGATGTGVSAIVEQYYLSTSSQTQTGGSWSETCPAWESGKYIWTRSRVTWTVGDPTTTQPVLAGGINSANETAADAKQAVSDLDGSLDQEEVFNRLTGGGSNQGIYLESGKLYVNGTYIKTGTINAGLVKAGTITDAKGYNYWNLSTGNLKTTNGTIGGFTISSSEIKNDVISLKSSGLHLLRDSTDIGFIGTNVLTADKTKYGLTFDLNYSGAYMGWGAEKYSTDTYYSLKWTYANKALSFSDGTTWDAGKLHAGCDIDMHNWKIKNIGGGVSSKLSLTVITDANKDGTFSFSNGCSMTFTDGLLTAVTWKSGAYT